MKESQVTCAKEKSFAVMQAPKGERDPKAEENKRRLGENQNVPPEGLNRQRGKRSNSSSATGLMQEVVQDRTYRLEKKVKRRRVRTNGSKTGRTSNKYNRFGRVGNKWNNESFEMKTVPYDNTATK